MSHSIPAPIVSLAFHNGIFQSKRENAREIKYPLGNEL
jgi:hypothetical protein